MTTNPEVDDQLPEWLHEQLTSEPLPLLSGDLAQRVATRVTRRRQATVAAAAALVAIAVAVPALYATSRSSTPPASSHTSSPAPPSSSAASPSAWGLSQACDYWRAAAAPVVKAYDAVHAEQSKTYTGAATWKNVRDLVPPFATASRTFAEQLLSPPHTWPPELAPWVPAFAAFWQSMATWEDRTARATTETEFNRLFETDPSVNPPVSYQEAAAASKVCPG